MNSQLRLTLPLEKSKIDQEILKNIIEDPAAHLKQLLGNVTTERMTIESYLRITHTENEDGKSPWTLLALLYPLIEQRGGLDVKEAIKFAAELNLNCQQEELVKLTRLHPMAIELIWN